MTDRFADQLSRFFEVFSNISDEPDNTLSHYCDLNALLSILTNHNLWATNIRFLNDREEMDFGLRVANDVLNEAAALTNSDSENKPKSKANRKPRFDAAGMPDVYVVSFCEKPDLLSQWRGYGTTGQSVSIQFRKHGLEELSKISDFALSKVTYGRAEAMNLLRRQIQSRDEIIAAIVSGSDLVSQIDYNGVVFRTSPQFKNEHFAEEQEWRLISTDKREDVRYRVRDNVLLPYVAIEAKPHHQIASITIGPGKDSELTKKSVQHFIDNSEAYKGIPVLQSKIPYRT